MYTVVFLALIAISGLILFRGIHSGKKRNIILGAALAAATLLFFWFMGFWGEKLWFDSLGYADRFWQEILIKVVSGLIGLAIGVAVLLPFALMVQIPKESGLPRKTLRMVPLALGGLIGISKGVGNWDTIFKFLYQHTTDIKEPILGMDAGFYMFTLPFLEVIYSLLFILSIIAVILTFLPLYAHTQRGLSRYFSEKSGARDVTPDEEEQAQAEKSQKGGGLFLSAASLFFVMLAVGKLLDRYRLLLDSGGITVGPGWTDANIRMPMFFVAAFIALLGAALLWFPALRRKIGKPFGKLFSNMLHPQVTAAGSVLILILVLWFVVLNIVPGLFQSLKVSPNEITMERQYINNNIELTRHGFNLMNISEEEFPVSQEFNRQMVEDNQGTISNIRLWDWRALDSVYKQFQEIRLYYEFRDIDIDRYYINGDYRSVMVSAREMETDNLPPKSQTFVNKHFKYTHGYGITMNTVNDFTDSGLPQLLIKDIPPQNEYESLRVDRPEIYYGELTDEYVVANSKEKEFDYPSGDENAYVEYAGDGGVQVSNFFRKLIFGYKFGGTKFLFSGYTDKDSRVMFYRDIIERVNRAAPFLTFDRDPYIVLIDGELHWIVEGYTTSTNFPYSDYYTAEAVGASRIAERRRGTEERLTGRINYIRNSVKAVVNPYNGDIDMYIYDESDALIKVWNRIFPGLFKNKSEMPTALKQHVRYPANYLMLQGEVYSKYHMTDPAVFYNQEDLWIKATEKYYNDVQDVKPYYVMWERPGSDEPEFVVMMPFTPKNRQVLIGWIAGASDPEHYGEFIAYKFPKDKRVLGTQQVETKIDQNSYLSSQLSLWSQRGSNVIRGNVIAIPIDDTMLYIEPIYLQSETAAYPELRLVAVMHDDNLSYAESFEDALKGLYSEDTGPQKLNEDLVSQFSSQQGQAGAGEQAEAGEQTAAEGQAAPAAPGAAELPEGMEQLIQSANSAFDTYFELLGEKRFGEAAQELDRLGRVLEQMTREQGQ
ncbi:MAG: UPF0182 family protein [Spirochaetota bacterium]